MSVSLEELVGAIHASPVQCVLYLTGGGSRALGYLLCVPGASRTVLEAVVPYSQESLAELLGRKPEQAVSAEVAEELAHRAFERAYELSQAAPALVGLSCTAGLATDRPRRGEHKCFVASCGYETELVRSLRLTKAARTRAEEEEVVARLILNALAEASGLEARVDLKLLPGEQVRDVTLDA